MYTDANLPTMDVLLGPYFGIKSCRPYSTLIRISLNTIKNAEKVFFRYPPYSEPVVCCHYKVYKYLRDNKMRRICFRFQLWTCKESRHKVHKGVTVCRRLNVKRDREGRYVTAKLTQKHQPINKIKEINLETLRCRFAIFVFKFAYFPNFTLKWAHPNRKA